MYIFESRLVNIPEELQNENRPLPLAETLLFTQDNKPQVKSTYVCPPMEELIEKQGQPLYDLAGGMIEDFASSGGSVVTNVNADIDGGNGLTLEYPVASNAYMSNLLQPIELPTFDVREAIYIDNHLVLTVGQEPHALNQYWADKVRYKYRPPESNGTWEEGFPKKPSATHVWQFDEDCGWCVAPHIPASRTNSASYPYPDEFSIMVLPQGKVKPDYDGITLDAGNIVQVSDFQVEIPGEDISKYFEIWNVIGEIYWGTSVSAFAEIEPGISVHIPLYVTKTSGNPDKYILNISSHFKTPFLFNGVIQVEFPSVVEGEYNITSATINVCGDFNLNS